MFILFLLVLSLSCENSTKPRKAVPRGTSKTDDKRPDNAVKNINTKSIKLATIPDSYEKWDHISFRSDGLQVLYKAIDGAKEFVVVSSEKGEIRGPRFESISSIIMDSEGARFAYTGKKNSKIYFVVDNQIITTPDDHEVLPAAVSQDGHVACENVDKVSNEWFISVWDGKREIFRSPGYPDTFRRPFFSPDGRRLLFELGDEQGRFVFFADVTAKTIVNKDALCAGCVAGNIVFSADSGRVIYDVNDKGRYFLVLYDFTTRKRKEIALPYPAATNFFLAPDGSRFAYTATKTGGYFLVSSAWENPNKRNEKGPYEGVVPPVFSRESDIFAYLVMKDGRWMNVVGAQESNVFYDGLAGAPVFSTDHERKIAYPAMKAEVPATPGMRTKELKGTWFMVVSPVDKPSSVKTGPEYDMVVSPVFSPDGSMIAYRARKGPMERAERFIVIADADTGKVIKEGPVGDEIWPPIWSEDGKAVGYGARIGRELWWKVEKLP